MSDDGGVLGPAPLTPSTVEAFRRDGAVALRGILAAGEVELLRDGVERDLADPGPLALRQSDTFFEDFRNWDRIEPFERVVRESRLAAAAAQLMGSERVRLFHDHVLVKEAGAGERTPWHQDQPYYCVDGAQNVSFWIPLDPVTRENTLEFVAGSHAPGTWYMPRTFVSKTPMVFEPGALAEVPDVDADRAAHEVVGWPLEPGDAVAFHMLTLHQAAGSATRRRAFSLRLLGDDATHAPRPHRTSPPYPELESLPAGAPLPEDVCPVLWP